MKAYFRATITGHVGNDERLSGLMTQIADNLPKRQMDIGDGTRCIKLSGNQRVYFICFGPSYGTLRVERAMYNGRDAIEVEVDGVPLFVYDMVNTIDDLVTKSGFNIADNGDIEVHITD
jgi:hypothetical protein